MMSMPLAGQGQIGRLQHPFDQEDEDGKSSSKDTEEEEARELGTVKWSVYWRYITLMGPVLAITIVISLLLMQVSPLIHVTF